METTLNIARMIRYMSLDLGTILIIIYQMLLAYCAILLLKVNSYAAEQLSLYAFYFLMMGVVLQFVSFILHGEMAKNNNV